VGHWRRLHNEELRKFYASPNIIRMIVSRRMRCEERVTLMGVRRSVYIILFGKPEGKRTLGRHKA
jgi:hypothetical protein